MLTSAILCALFAPLLAPYDPIKTNPAKLSQPLACRSMYWGQITWGAMCSAV